MSDSAGGGGGGGGGGGAQVGDPALLAILKSRAAAGGAPAAAGGAPAANAPTTFLGSAYRALESTGVPKAAGWALWALKNLPSASTMAIERLTKKTSWENVALKQVWYVPSEQIKLILNDESTSANLREIANNRVRVGKERATALLKLIVDTENYRKTLAKRSFTMNDGIILRQRALFVVCSLIDVNKKDIAKYDIQLELETALRESGTRAQKRASTNSQTESREINIAGVSSYIPGLTQTVDVLPYQLSDFINAFLQMEMADPTPLPEQLGPYTSLGDVIARVFEVGRGVREHAVLAGIKKAAGSLEPDRPALDLANAFVEKFCTRERRDMAPEIVAEGAIVESKADAEAAAIAEGAAAEEGLVPAAEAGAAGGAPAEAGAAGGAPAEAGGAGGAPAEAGSKRKEHGGYRKTRRNKNKNKRKTRSKNRKSKNKSRSRSRSRSSRG